MRRTRAGISLNQRTPGIVLMAIARAPSANEQFGFMRFQADTDITIKLMPVEKLQKLGKNVLS